MNEIETKAKELYKQLDRAKELLAKFPISKYPQLHGKYFKAVSRIEIQIYRLLK